MQQRGSEWKLLPTGVGVGKWSNVILSETPRHENGFWSDTTMAGKQESRRTQQQRQSGTL